MARPAVFFDRDNTLIHNDGYLGNPAQVRLLDGAAAAVAGARAAGFAVVTVSNQSGVGRGLITEDDVRAVDARMDDLLLAGDPGAVIDRHYFCPFHPEADVVEYRKDSALRKPKPGMLLAAADELNLDLPRSWLVGDAPRDVEAGQAAGCRTILLRDPTVTASPAAAGAAQPDHVAESLSEALGLIVDVPDTAPAPPPVDSPQEELVAAIRDLRANHHEPDFSVAKLLAGITQVVALAVLFLAYLNEDAATRVELLATAIFTQLLTATLWIMAKR
jgi:D-glycero-D-manno-heptose 1,7-bisphosphate phosphatase